MDSTRKKAQQNSKKNIGKDIKLWVVTEGMVGTENQCLSVADLLGGSKCVVKRIGLKFPFNFLCPYIIKRAPRWAIKNDDWQEPWPDIVIASGRKAVSVALSIPDAFRVFIQNPRINVCHFDLVAVPAHDNLRGDNVIVTKGAPNRINALSLHAAFDKLAPEFTHLPAKKVALVIGGNSKTHKIPADFAKRLFAQMLPFLQSGECGFLITCSRRTPEIIREQLQNLFSTPNCYFWDGAGDNPYMAFLDAADVILVTEDSTSMLSDALTTGKPTYRLKIAGGSAKFDRLYKTLENHGGLRVFDGDLETWDYEPLNDAKIIADEIKKRFEHSRNNA